MKPLSPYHLIYCVFALFFIIAGCSPDLGYQHNDQIRESKRNELHELTTKVFDLMKSGKTRELEEHISRELLTNRDFNAQATNIGHRMVMDSFSRFDEYYVMNKYLYQDTIGSSAVKDNAYQLIYPAYAQEMYIAFYTPQNIPNREMVTAIFSKYDYGWKLSALNISKHTFNGKTAPELYEEAKDSYGKGYLTDALNKMTLAVTCLTPSNIWRYNADRSIREYFNDIAKEANNTYKLPLVMKEVATHPAIIGFYNKTTPEGSFPIISYLSRIKLKDTAALHAENVQMHKALDKVMPGLNTANKYVYYLAYNRLPSVTENVERVEMEDKRR